MALIPQSQQGSGFRSLALPWVHAVPHGPVVHHANGPRGLEDGLAAAGKQHVR